MCSKKKLILLTYIGHLCYHISVHIDDKNMFMVNEFVQLYIVHPFMVEIGHVKLYI